MKQYIWGCILGAAFTSLSVSAAEVKINEFKGLVLVNNGQAFISAKPGQVLHSGDQVYILDHSVVVLAQGEACFVKIRQNALVTIPAGSLCEINASTVKFMGTRYAAAIGIVNTPTNDAAKPAGNGALGGIVIEEEPIQISDADTPKEVPASESGGIEGLATKLAVPATVLGAIGFSAIVGGAGEPVDVGPTTGGTSGETGDNTVGGVTGEPGENGEPISPA
ncbi:MAG: hypothetical protein OEZ43_10055 [Gammaproteobacteria bacterium]|nr:hypothetical protein [Gammaproteobacteria bacterium]